MHDAATGENRDTGQVADPPMNVEFKRCRDALDREERTGRWLGEVEANRRRHSAGNGRPVFPDKRIGGRPGGELEQDAGSSRCPPLVGHAGKVARPQGDDRRIGPVVHPNRDDDDDDASGEKRANGNLRGTRHGYRLD